MSKLKTWISSIGPEAHQVFRRFPLAALLVAAFTLVLLIETNTQSIGNDLMARLVGGIILAAYLSVIMALYGERRAKPFALPVKILVVILALLSGYFYRSLVFLPPVAIGAAILALGHGDVEVVEGDNEGLGRARHVEEAVTVCARPIPAVLASEFCR